jgi:type II secretory pathway pseudopilin PulG
MVKIGASQRTVSSRNSPGKETRVGFTTIEAIIALTLAGILGSLVAPFLNQSLDVWSLSLKQSEQSDRHRHVLSVFTADVESSTAISLLNPTSFQLTQGGNVVLYQLVTSGPGGSLQLQRVASGISVLVDNLSADGIRFRYFNALLQETAVATEVRLVRISLVTTYDGITQTSGTSAILNESSTYFTSRL